MSKETFFECLVESLQNEIVQQIAGLEPKNALIIIRDELGDIEELEDFESEFAGYRETVLAAAEKEVETLETRYNLYYSKLVESVESCFKYSVSDSFCDDKITIFFKLDNLSVEEMEAFKINLKYNLDNYCEQLRDKVASDNCSDEEWEDRLMQEQICKAELRLIL